MVATRPQTLSLLFVVLVILVTESHSFIPQQQVSMSDDKGTEMELSLLVNQLAVLRLLNESSASCSLHERKLQDLSLDLDVKTRELKNYLLSMNKEWQSMTAASLEEINKKKEEFQSMTASSLNEINRKTEEGKQVLKEAVSKASLQQVATPIPDVTEGWRQYQSSYYKLFTRKLNYEQAAADCRAHGGYLASIGSEGEYTFLVGMVECFTYIGLSDQDREGVFKWEDGSPFIFSRWAGGEPSDRRGRENCVELYRFFAWNDVPCSEEYHYICERSFQ